MSTRAVRLAAAGAFLIGFALFASGLVLAVAASWPFGRDLGSGGATLMSVTRLVSWRWRLPTP